MAIRRLAARRGEPTKIYSDNGTNFRGADRELKENLSKIDFQEQQKFCTAKGIDWIFIPPGAPHMGGAWESLIKTVKSGLRIVLKEQAPKEETLQTLMAEVEHTVNSRPLTDVYLDPRDDEALTPNHFLIGSSSGRVISDRFRSRLDCSKKQWQIAQRLADAFWQRWLRDYVPTLMSRKKWISKSESFAVGDVVLIIDYQAPRNFWPKGIIVEVFPGPDSHVRVVKVRTLKGSFIRPVIKLTRLTRRNNE